MKVQVTSSKRTRGPKRIEMLFTESITFQLYRRLWRALNGLEQRLEKDNAGCDIEAAHRLKPVLLGKFVFPAGDDDGGEAVAEDVYGGAAHVHELIDGEEEE